MTVTGTSVGLACSCFLSCLLYCPLNQPRLATPAWIYTDYTMRKVKTVRSAPLTFSALCSKISPSRSLCIAARLFPWEKLVEVGYSGIRWECSEVCDRHVPIVRTKQRDIGNRFSHIGSCEEHDARCARRECVFNCKAHCCRLSFSLLCHQGICLKYIPS